MSEPADVYEPGASIGAPNQTPALVLYADGDRQHQNPNYSLPLAAYTQQDIESYLQKGRLSALDNAVRDLKCIIKPGKKREHALRTIVQNLFVAWYTKGNPFVAVQMSNGAYTKGSHMNLLYLDRLSVRGVVTALTNGGYIEEYPEFYNAEKRAWRCTRIRAARGLVELFIKYALDIRTFKKESPLVILRDKDKSPVNITRGRLAAEAKRFHPALIEINEMLRGAVIQLRLSEDEFIKTFVIARADGKKPCTPPNPCDIAYKRVFNVDYQHGGRFYGPWWQGIPRDLRKHITINGFPVVELDYKSIHPTMLYLREGLPPKKEPYVVEPYGEPYKPVFKKMLNMAINAERTESAMRALRMAIIEDSELDRVFHKCTFNEWLVPAWEAMCKFHEPIKRHLSSGAGLELQRLDSDIAEHVMLKMKQQGIPVLAVHDSFIVPNVHEHALGAAMIEASKAIVGGVIPYSNKMPENSLFGGRFLRNSA